MARVYVARGLHQPRVMHSSFRSAAISFSLAALISSLAPSLLHAEYSPEYSSDANGPHSSEPYATWLLGSYLVAPLLATGVAFGIAGVSRSEVTEGGVIIGAAVGALLPAAVHVMFGEPLLGVRAYLLWPLITVGGAIMGGLAGVVVYALFADHDQSGLLGDDDFGSLAYVAVGALAGLCIGGVLWPVFDILDASQRDAKRHGATRLTWGVAPAAHGGAIGTLRASF